MKKILLIGNPNVGKTAILNRLSKSSYSIGNWAGVTVAKQESIITLNQDEFSIVDIPGLYSLNPNTQDEIVASELIFSEKYDLIINVIDLHNIQANFLLTLELMELGMPMISVLNFYDEFQKSNHLDLETLQNNLLHPVFPISAKTGYGFDTLNTFIQDTSNYQNLIPKSPISNTEPYQQIIKQLDSILVRYPLAKINSRINPEFVALQLGMGNALLLRKFATNKENINSLIKQDIKLYNDLISKRDHIFHNVTHTKLQGKKSIVDISQYIDKFLLSHVWGYLFFVGFITVLFTMVFNSANPLIDFIDWLINEKFYTYIQSALVDTAPELQSFILDGIVSGVGSVLTFVPLIFILYIFLAVVEESGYLSRIAFLLEYPFSKIGLSGKSFFPLMLGLGCTVPSIYSSKILETPESRRVTAIVSSLISCGARLPVYALFVAAFFPKNGNLIMLSIYLLGVIFAILLAFILSHFKQFKSETHSFIMLLPPYRFPSITVVLKTAWFHAHSYIKRASGLILGMLMIIWVFSYFPSKGDIKESYLAKMGTFIQPIFVPLGFGDRWELAVSIIPSLAAKEAVVGFLGQVLPQEVEESDPEEETTEFSVLSELQEIGVELVSSIKTSLLGLVSWNIIESFTTPEIEELEEEGGVGIIVRLQNIWKDDPLAQRKAYSFLLFILMTLPCVTAIGALKQELETPYFLLAMSIYIVLPFILSFIFYQISLLF